MDASGAQPTSLALPDGFAAHLADERAAYRLPRRLPQVAEQLVHAFLALLFPHFTEGAGAPADDRAGDGARSGVEEDADAFFTLLAEALALPDLDEADQRRVAQDIVAALPDLRTALLRDAEAIAGGDPAAGGVDEVVLAYPGFFATAVHRLAHRLWTAEVPLLPRVLGELAHRATGIDLHPGARIGADFAIDHGTGIVVGETCVIGDRVRLYQGVTLGALVVEKSMQSKRHPTVEDDVVIYSGATILGGDTVIGAGARIGGNVWLTRSVPPGSFVATSAGVDRRRRPDRSDRSGDRSHDDADAGESSDADLEFYL